MMSTIILHELNNIFFSPKFTLTFAVISALMILSIFVGIQQYQTSVRQYETTSQLVREEMREARGWTRLNSKVLRKPDPVQIFVSGVNNDVGRMSDISSFFDIKLAHSTFSDDPIFAIFRMVDFAFIVSVIFSLLAILFTYDAINGEAERGTLQLIFSNAVPRAHYIIGKFIGTLLGLVIPLLVPILVSLLFLLIWKIPMTADHWLSVSALIAVSLLYLTFFVALGILLSTVTKRSAVSFLYSLVLWVCLVFIIPRAAGAAAGQMIQVPTVAEAEAQRDAYAKDRWDQYGSLLHDKWKTRNAPTQTMSKEEGEAYRDEHMWAWMEEDDRDRRQVQVDIDAFADRVREDVRNKKTEQEKLAFLLSRFSPGSSYQLAAMNLSGTDISLKERYESALVRYRSLFNDYKDKKQKESGDIGGIRITFDSEKGMRIDAGREKGVLDISDMPQFVHPSRSLKEAVTPAIIDFGILSVFSLMAFAGAFLRFLQYDVR